MRTAHPDTKNVNERAASTLEAVVLVVRGAAASQQTDCDVRVNND